MRKRIYIRKPQEWKYLKYKIRKFSKSFSEEAASSKKIEFSALETKLKRNDPEYIHCKEEIDKLYQGKINGAIIRGRCDWYEHGEKSSVFLKYCNKIALFKIK